MESMPLIIFDTDMDTDCDDVGALAMLLEAQKASRIEILGIVADSVSSYAAPFCEVMTYHYGKSIPIGAVHARSYTKAFPDRFASYIEHSEKCDKNGRAYNRILTETLGKTDEDYPTATKLYRKLLSKSDDGSVTVLCVGMLTAVTEALLSEPDEASSMSGAELFANKVKRIIVMCTPEKENDFNLRMDARASAQFFSICPVPIYISAHGSDVITGMHLSSMLSIKHPLRRAYEIWLGGKGRGRSSWDLIAALFAMRCDSPYLTLSDGKDYEYDQHNRTLISRPSNAPRCKVVTPSCTKNELEELLSALMVGDVSTLNSFFGTT